MKPTQATRLSSAALAPVERVVVETKRPTIDYETFVLRYGATQRINALMIAASVSALATALLVSSELARSVLLIICVATGIAGVVSLFATREAHRQYYDKLAQVSVTERHEAIAGADYVDDAGSREIVETPSGESIVAPWRLTVAQRAALATHLREHDDTWRKQEIRALRIFPHAYLDRWREGATSTQVEGVASFYIRAGWVDASTMRSTEFGRVQLRAASQRHAAAAPDDKILAQSSRGRGVQ